MPRVLPWATLKRPSERTPKRRATTNAPEKKRSRREQSPSDSEKADYEEPLGPQRTPKSVQAREASTSPPPEAPDESFMTDGLENDDKYRMVEDEFASIAHKFTTHLHAAEYKRQKKMAKTRNAQTINKISRPVVGRMPDQTRRKVDGVNRSKKQQSTIQGLLTQQGIKDEDSESDDFKDLPYVGTTLHGLMDSPRKKALSLAKFSSSTTTRAAAAFQKPAALPAKPYRGTASASIPAMPSHKIPSQSVNHAEKAADFSDGSDHLDRPVAISKSSISFRTQTLDAKPLLESNASQPFLSSRFESYKSTKALSPPPRPTTNTNDTTSDPFDFTAGRSARMAKKLEQARARILKQEKEEQEQQKKRKRSDLTQSRP